MPKWITTFLSLALLLAASCGRMSVPEKGSDAVTLMTKYNNQARYDDAIRVAQEWLKRHPEDPSEDGRFYEQMAITYLLKAANDKSHKDQWVQQAVANYEKDLAVHRMTDVDIELYIVGRGYESAGDLSTHDSCLYYRRAVNALEEEVPFIQGDSYTAYGKTVQLAPVRRGNEEALERVKTKLDKASCK